MPQEKSLDSLLRDLQERAKELNCLYRVDELLNRADLEFPRAIEGLLEAIPPGWQYPRKCQAEVICYGKAYRSRQFKKSYHTISPC